MSRKQYLIKFAKTEIKSEYLTYVENFEGFDKNQFNEVKNDIIQQSVDHWIEDPENLEIVIKELAREWAPFPDSPVAEYVSEMVKTALNEQWDSVLDLLPAPEQMFKTPEEAATEIRNFIKYVSINPNKWFVEEIPNGVKYWTPTHGVFVPIHELTIEQIMTRLKEVVRIEDHNQTFSQQSPLEEKVLSQIKHIESSFNENLMGNKRNIYGTIYENIFKADINPVEYTEDIMKMNELSSKIKDGIIDKFVEVDIEGVLERRDVATFSDPIDNESYHERLERKLEDLVFIELEKVVNQMLNEIESAPPLTAKTVMGSAPDNTEPSSEMEM